MIQKKTVVRKSTFELRNGLLVNYMYAEIIIGLKLITKCKMFWFKNRIHV